MKKIVLMMVLMFFVVGLSNGLAQEKPRIGVLRFTNNTSTAFWWNANVGRELQDMLAAEMASSGEFQVLERREIDAVLSEQDLSASGRISQGTLVKMGKIKGAKYLIAGTVSAFESSTSGAGGKVRFKGLSLGGKKEKAYVAVDVKVVDTETSEIVDSRTIEATVKSKALGAGLSLRNFSIAGGAHKKTPVGKAIRACILYIVEYMECSMVEGKDAPCMRKWNAMDEKRKDKTKGSIDLD
jgi:curli biogenesis system outer membrane secretion channel CsgG